MGRARQLAGRGNNDSLVLNSSAASTDVGELLLLNGTDASSSNAGFSTLQEDATGNALDGGVVRFDQVPIVPSVAFKGYLPVDQGSISHNTTTKVTLNTVLYDTHGYFDNTTNYRYQPLIAGYYQVNASLQDISNTDVFDFILSINKTGAQEMMQRVRLTELATNADFYASSLNVSDIIHFDGVNDYIEMYYFARSEDEGTIVAGGDAYYTTALSAHLIQRTS